MTSNRILLLSAYDARSHRYWHRQLTAQITQHQWQVLSLKDHSFAWRMGGNALNFKAAHDVFLSAPYDLLIATSMTDLSTLRGLYPHLACIPNILYFHENQFAYPPNHHQQGMKEIQLRSIFSALAADHLLFNSNYNRDTFLSGVTEFAGQMPDGIPDKLVSDLQKKTSTLPVPITADCLPNVTPIKSRKALHVVWNHRWEHDKGPDTLLELLRICQQRKINDVPIQFHIIGQQFNKKPAAMQAIEHHHSAQCLHLGYVESRSKYLKILQNSDVVLSTALHDFQGIAMLEAVACGCVPLTPNRLVYPELYPSSNHYPSTPENPHKEAQAIYQMLQNPDHLKAAEIHCRWQNLKPEYEYWLGAAHE